MSIQYFMNLASFPSVGATGIWYHDCSTGNRYYSDGTAYWLWQPPLSAQPGNVLQGKK